MVVIFFPTVAHAYLDMYLAIKFDTIEHIWGKNNMVADALSRVPGSEVKVFIYSRLVMLLLV